MRRFFTNARMDETIALTGSEHNHLANVLRCSVGEDVIILCGDKFNYTYRIKNIQRHATELEFVKRAKNVCNPTRRLTVFMAIVKTDNVALVVQKLTELGATDLVLFTSARCNVSPVLFNVTRLRAIAEQSCKQCGRSIPLTVNGVFSFEQMLVQIGNHKAFLADESTQDLPHLHFFSYSTTDNAALVIGPEGGFTKSEHDQMVKQIIPITMGKRILRAETAVIAGAAIMLAHMGEL